MSATRFNCPCGESLGCNLAGEASTCTCNARCNDVDGGVGVPCNTCVLRVFCGISPGRFDRCAARLRAPGTTTVSRGSPAGTNRPGGFAPPALAYPCVLLLPSFTRSKKMRAPERTYRHSYTLIVTTRTYSRIKI